jgi:hypothetical protein
VCASKVAEMTAMTKTLNPEAERPENGRGNVSYIYANAAILSYLFMQSYHLIGLKL